MSPTRISIAAGIAGIAMASAVGLSAANASPDQSPSPTPTSAAQYDAGMVKALAKSLGVSEGKAVERLDSESKQQKSLERLDGDLRTLGAYFDNDGKLTVNVADEAAAAKVRDAGLTARVPERGQERLDKVMAALDSAAAQRVPAGVNSWAVDLATDTVTVTVSDDSTPAARAFLKKAKTYGSAVKVVNEKSTLVAQQNVTPGHSMDVGGGVCSVGYGARDRSGKQFLVSAGHCLEGLPDLTYEGNHFAKATNTRFHKGQNSVDMGIAKLDKGVKIETKVHGKDVRGSKRASSGAAMCKEGQTTGWTCGKVKSYNVTVTYDDPHGGPQTTVKGLASSTVCTEGGDSGGAYISGNQAQGMTSGGPQDQQCDGSSGKSSFFQPLDDTLRHYGLSLNTR
ncbi:S1 family peptidase [Streptomyces sp. NEAU-Y11]|nr:S1 family peptidase [Streptomyces sp. NEAU-Y11]MCP9211536.1 S1 family peptidase [Streptomyces sp. NEAU-Y11]